MKIPKILALLVAVSCVSGRTEVPVPIAAPAATLAIVGAAVVDLTGGPPISATIVIEGGRISAVGPAAQVVIPDGAAVIDAAGAFVIPGLWDMHAHTTYASPAEVERVFFAALVAHGVLGIRDPGSRFPAEQTRRCKAFVVFHAVCSLPFERYAAFGSTQVAHYNSAQV